MFRAAPPQQEYPDMLKVRVRIWDGDTAVVPTVLLEVRKPLLAPDRSCEPSWRSLFRVTLNVARSLHATRRAPLQFLRKDVLIYKPHARINAGGAELSASGAAASAGGANGVCSQVLSMPTSLGGAGRRAHRDPSQTSLEEELRASHDFHSVMRKIRSTRSKDLLLQPSRREVNEESFCFFYRGRRIRRRHFDFFPVRIVDVMDHSAGETLGWAQNEIDVALNWEAERYLKTQRYGYRRTFAVTIDAVELTEAASTDERFGKNPATYVMISHGEERRASQVVTGTRSPMFQFTAGAIEYHERLPLHVELYLVVGLDGTPNVENDSVIGSMYLPAPFLPPPRTMAAPEVMTASLGLNVGVIQISLRGPTLRHEREEGCVLAPCGLGGPCICYVCGSPPCVPSLGICGQRTYRSASLCYTRTEQWLGPTLCCCLQLGFASVLVAGVTAKAVMN